MQIEEPSNTCPICFDDNKDELLMLECKHFVCNACFEAWHVKKVKATCSLCRQAITLPESVTSTPPPKKRIDWKKTGRIVVYCILLSVCATTLLNTRSFKHYYFLYMGLVMIFIMPLTIAISAEGCWCIVEDNNPENQEHQDNTLQV